MGFKVRGTRKINKNFARISQQLTVGSDKGIRKVAKVVARDVGWSGKFPLIPVRTGALRRSFFSIPYKSRGDRNRSIRFGYRSRYAHYQHDPYLYTTSWPKWRYTREGSSRNYMRSTIMEMIIDGSMKNIVKRNIRYRLRK